MGDIFLLDFIIKYWLEILFGLITTGATLFAKRIYSLYKSEKKTKEKIIIDEFDKKIQSFYVKTQQDNEAIAQRIDGIENLMYIFKKGLLSIQGDHFKKKCLFLLEENHKVTLDEWLQIVTDHDTYKSLGGNHEGDELFKLVEIKADKFLTDLNIKK